MHANREEGRYTHANRGGMHTMGRERTQTGRGRGWRHTPPLLFACMCIPLHACVSAPPSPFVCIPPPCLCAHPHLPSTCAPSFPFVCALPHRVCTSPPSPPSCSRAQGGEGGRGVPADGCRTAMGARAVLLICGPPSSRGWGHRSPTPAHPCALLVRTRGAGKGGRAPHTPLGATGEGQGERGGLFQQMGAARQRGRVWSSSSMGSPAAGRGDAVPQPCPPLCSASAHTRVGEGQERDWPVHPVPCWP
jgi:hypothetical protein